MSAFPDLTHLGMGTPNVNSVQKGGAGDGVVRSAAHSRAFRRLGIPAAALSIVFGAGQLAAAAPGEAATTSPTRVAVGHAPALPKGAVAAAAPAGSTKLGLDIELNSGHAAELAAYAAGVGNRNSPYYHQYLSSAQVAQYFGASSAQISAVKAQLEAAGLTVGSISSDHLFVSAVATVTQAQSAFGVHIAGYSAAGRSFYANTTAPTVPSAISGDVAQIVGLDDVDYAVPLDSLTTHAVRADSSVTAGTDIKPNYSVNGCSQIGEAFAGSPYSNGAGYYTADTLSNIYGFNPEMAQGDDGAGVTVALVELASYDPTGVADIDSCYGHKTSVTQQKVDGGPTDTPTTSPATPVTKRRWTSRTSPTSRPG